VLVLVFIGSTVVRVDVGSVLVLVLEEGARLTTLAIILSPFACMALIGAVIVDKEGVDSATGPACDVMFLADRIRLLAPLDPTD